MLTGDGEIGATSEAHTGTRRGRRRGVGGEVRVTDLRYAVPVVRNHHDLTTDVRVAFQQPGQVRFMQHVYISVHLYETNVYATLADQRLCKSIEVY